MLCVIDKDGLVKLAMDLCNVPSPLGYEDKVARLLRDRMQEEGLVSRLQPERRIAEIAARQPKKTPSTFTFCMARQSDRLVFSGRARLKLIGIGGEILPTPGHSDDSVSVLLDNGAAFTGDLTPLSLAGNDDSGRVAASWQLLREHGATQIYPGHGPVRPIETEWPL